MPYSLRRDDTSIECGIRRLAQSQLGEALDALSDSGLPVPARIVQAHRSLRRTRNVVGLVRTVFPHHRREISALHDAERSFEDMRGAAALLAAARRNAPLLSDLLGADRQKTLLSQLTDDLAERETAQDVPARLIQLRVALLSLWERAGSWSLSADGRPALAAGLSRSYGEAQAAMDVAQRGGRGSFGIWRGPVMDHRDHAHLLKRTVPGPMEAHIAMADVLADVLGEHHDLGLLIGHLDRGPEGIPPELVRSACRALSALQAQIEPPALALAAAVFAEPADGLACRFSTYWDIYRGGLIAVDAAASPPKAIAAL